MSNPRIYISIGTFYPIVGGAERQAIEHGRCLHKRGYNVTIVTFRQNKAWKKYEVIEGVRILRVAGTLLGGREKLPRVFQKILYAMALVVMGWTLWQRRRCYDILEAYQLTLLALPTALVALFARKPMITVVCNSGLENATKPLDTALLSVGSLDASAPWLRVYGRIPVGGDLADLERMGQPFVRLVHRLLRSIHAVAVVLSSRMEGYLAAHNFALQETLLIPNGVDITRFSPSGNETKIPEEERSQVVVCVARICYQKGIDVLLQAWRLVQSEAPGARLIIVGTGPIQNQLEHMAQALGVARSVEFAGVRDDVPAQFRRGAVAVLPSRFEGMPNTILEAMACGVPCVATRVSGSEDIIQHGVNGLLVESEDYQGLAEALLTLLRDPVKTSQCGQAARAILKNTIRLIISQICMYGFFSV